MGRVCAICSHDKRLDIDRALTSGKNMTEIATTYGVAYSSVVGHRDNHLSRQLMKSVELRETSHLENISNDILSVYHRVMSCLEKAERQNKSYLFLESARELRSYAEFLIKLQATFVKLQEEAANQEQEATKVKLDLSLLTDGQLKDLIGLYSGSKDSELLKLLSFLLESGHFLCPDCRKPLEAVRVPMTPSRDLHGAGTDVLIRMVRTKKAEATAGQGAGAADRRFPKNL
jgi:hypothetical protein